MAVLDAIGSDAVLVDAAILDGSFFSLDGDCLSLGSGEKRLELSLQDARGWVRRLAAPGWRSSNLVNGSRPAAERSAYIALVVAIASHPGVRWLTPYPRMIAAENKIRQGAHARRLGIRTPQTAVVSHPSAIPRELGEVIVVKPLGPGHFTDALGEARVVWATELERDDTRLTALSGAPFLLQQRLRPRRHLRVVTCNAQAWTCALDADALPLDWRSNDDAHHAFKAVREPAVEAAAVAVAGDMGVAYSSQDWIDDGEASPAFIDLNPAGQWLFLPDSVAAAVTGAIAAHLTGT